MFQGFFQRHGESMFTTSLPDVKYQDIVFIAIYNQSDIASALSHRTSEKCWHIFQSAPYDLDTQGDFYPELYVLF